MQDTVIDIQSDIDKAAEILKSAGCTECYIFGSISKGQADVNSDIDIAVRGLPPEKFFFIYGQLALQISRVIDLVDLDDGTRFSQKLRRRGPMTRVF
jgi:predicted nucleotidyltransferase